MCAGPAPERSGPAADARRLTTRLPVRRRPARTIGRRRRQLERAAGPSADTLGFNTQDCRQAAEKKCRSLCTGHAGPAHRSTTASPLQRQRTVQPSAPPAGAQARPPTTPHGPAWRWRAAPRWAGSAVRLAQARGRQQFAEPGQWVDCRHDASISPGRGRCTAVSAQSGLRAPHALELGLRAVKTSQAELPEPELLLIQPLGGPAIYLRRPALLCAVCSWAAISAVRGFFGASTSAQPCPLAPAQRPTRWVSQPGLRNWRCCGSPRRPAPALGSDRCWS